MKIPDKTALWFGLATLLSLSFGCAASHQSVALEQNVYRLESQVQELERRVESLEGAIQGGGQGRQSLADLYARLEALQVEMGALRGQVETQARQIERAAGGGTQASPAHVSSAPQGTAPVEPEPVIRMPEGGEPAQSTPEGPSPPATAVVKPPEDPEKAHYNRALDLFQKSDYEGARKEFLDFASKYPDSELADNAYFWVGECYYLQERYREAVESYQVVLDRYPKGNKVPYALLKQGAAFHKLGDPTAARILYERVIEDHPDTPQAEIARKWLANLP
ncbi:tol-pal system protein YbgF [Desulfoglaeba alkanexedens]|jgi:tol-pal system protein YbgF|uniref:Tol-pal system protein YbgF n=1 Tax=Desulfoglaeba alkanexedens ALDC TaxID=980445 RepID=A0A4P8L4B4_9BACT|nr:tol-pal system protein YbgF [Desulfoglaeba alkanexedens]QCQ22826.1 tol-pal system protein YbgF [Desulfoglaeba alkanexedens ALDC]